MLTNTCKALAKQALLPCPSHIHTRLDTRLDARPMWEDGS